MLRKNHAKKKNLSWLGIEPLTISSTIRESISLPAALPKVSETTRFL